MWEENSKREREEKEKIQKRREEDLKKQQEERAKTAKAAKEKLHNFAIQNQPKTEIHKPQHINYEAILKSELAQPQSPIKQKPTQWTLDVLLSLEWKRFEEVCKEYLILMGQDAKLTRIGANGGVDIEIWKENHKHGLVQCKAWISKIGVKEIRELYGIMASEQTAEGIFMTTSSFTQDAIIFSRDKKITLLDGQTLVKKIKSLEIPQQNYLINVAIAGDYTTPTCARCNQKMIKRTGNHSGKDFWGCINFPRCRSTMQIRKA